MSRIDGDLFKLQLSTHDHYSRVLDLHVYLVFINSIQCNGGRLGIVVGEGGCSDIHINVPAACAFNES